MYLRSLIATLLTTGTFWLSSTQLASSADSQTRTDEDSEYHSRLWKIEDLENLDDGKQPVSWLFGTLHVENPEILKLVDPLVLYIDQSDRLIIEVDTLELKRRNYEEHLYLPDEESLQDIIGEKLFQSTLEALQPNGMTATALDRYRPFAPILALASPETKTGLFVDEKIRRLASVRDKEIVGIETLSEQMNIFTGMSNEDQIELLRYAVQTHDDFESDLERLIEKYQLGDIGGLLELSRAQMSPPDPMLARRFEQRLLFDRNKIMVSRLIPMLEEQSNFIAIGAAHLPGEAGVIELLRERGYRVTAVSNP